ncbi:DNA double-strand break repair nuclease NurA [Pelolinea submarina]|uniref:NurA domain-containing protein n=1 Tax=Pelolinea submarina TaxID=913107 RepID=A0A347ZNL7_9CHLR|nr:DNA double-strand break repair nuclease NurA [Pelolinea submarina]REG08501.1 NurA domain-containing protein [Pelolinea submarina]BBB46898.1 hypothetical protein Pelsub_P0125 [Pelolinea submarina]
MPLNYLGLQPQIQQYAQNANQSQAHFRQVLENARELFKTCASQPYDEIRKRCQGSGKRCALPLGEAFDQSYPPPAEHQPCMVLAADGSQIISSPHDAIPISLINTSLICMNTGSSDAPQISITSEILSEDRGGIEFNLLSEDLISLRRDVAELRILNDWTAPNDLPVAALRDGPLELYHEPRQGDQFEREFKNYIDGLAALAARDFTLAGYIDRTRAGLLGQMLAIYFEERSDGLAELRDTTLLAGILPAGQRSAIFALQSSSSDNYPEALRIHFFYLNVSTNDNDYIVRVEIPAWVAEDTDKVNRLHALLLAQCRIMGGRPYPYLLHRAHETAVVHFDEKAQLQDALAQELQRQGLDVPQPSNKLAAKGLQKRTRM